MSDDRGSSTGTVLLAFLVGAAVGAGITLLLSPKSGPEMRESLKELGDRLAKQTGLKRDDDEAAGDEPSAPIEV